MGRKPYDPLKVIQEAAAKIGMQVDFSQLGEARREADATILYSEDQTRFREAECKQCRRYFATNYESVAMCSDNCRREYLRTIGIEWNPNKTQNERWAGKIPLTVPPEALLLVKSALESQQENHAVHQ